MPFDRCASYSFSFQLKTCQDIQYYRKTTPGHKLKEKVERFILDFIKNQSNPTEEAATKGRPPLGKNMVDIDKYTPFQFSLKKSTIKKIQNYKEQNKFDLDKNVEEYIKLNMPSRIIR